MKILKQEENSILNRSAVEFSVDHKGSKTPTREEVLKQISEKLNVSPELIRIKSIFTKYGGESSKISANIYGNIESLKSIEEFRKKKKEKKEKKAPAKKA